jgi:hypothetical protein
LGGESGQADGHLVRDPCPSLVLHRSSPVHAVNLRHTAYIVKRAGA